MRKTSVYLTDEEAETLRRAAEATGRSQSQLIREGIRQIAMNAGSEQRRFHSMGKGHGGGRPYTPWQPDEVYRAVMGQE
jgi:hypothetical protein